MKKQNDSINTIGTLYQVILWIVFSLVFYHAFLEEFELERGLRPFIVYYILFIWYLINSFFNIRILIPQLFEKKKYTLYATSLFGILFILSILMNILVFKTLGLQQENHEAPLKMISYFLGFVKF